MKARPVQQRKGAPQSDAERRDGMPRREALRVLGSTGLALWAPTLVAWLGACSRGDAGPSQALRNFFSSPTSARIVGNAYLEMRPEERDVGRLLDLLAHEDPQTQSELNRFDPPRLLRYLLQQHVDDFDQNRIVNLLGWYVSETEARLCALGALAASESAAG